MVMVEISETAVVLLLAIALYAVFGILESLLSRLEAWRNRRRRE